MGYAKNDADKVKLNIADGANANTKITVAGMTAKDSVKAVLNLTDSAEVSLAGLVVEDGGFKITASTATKKLLVHWIDVDAG